MKEQTILLLLVMLLFQTSYAQPLKGTIKNEHGQALEGVQISLLQTSRQAQSDSLGEFTIRISRKKRKLNFQHPDYLSRTIKVKKEKTLDIVLIQDQTTSSVITALQQSRSKSSLGYSIPSLTPDQIENSFTSNVYEVLQSKVPGLQIIPTGGQVGSNAHMIMRGHASINFWNAPLLIVDGMPIDNSLDKDDLWGTPASNRGMDLNPNEIESISVLKPGTASALYGLRGSNGIILISTKEEHEKGLHINYQYRASIDRVNKLPETTSAFTRGRLGAYSNVSHLSWGPAYASNPIFPWGTLIDLDGDGISEDVSEAPIPQFQNNYEQFWQNGNSQDHQLQISGNKAGQSFMASLGHFRQNSVVTNQDYQRSNLLFQGIKSWGKGAQLRLSTRYIKSGGKRFRTATGLTDGLLYWPATWDLNTYPWKEEAGEKVWFSSFIAHPNWVLEEEGEDWDLDRFIGSINVTLPLSEKWQFFLNTGLDTYRENREEVRPIGSVVTANDAGDLTISQFNQFNLNTDAFVSGQVYKNDNWEVNLLGGLNYYRIHSDDEIRVGESFLEPMLFTLDNTLEQGLETLLETRNTLGLFAQTHLDYKNLFHFQLSLRKDWLSDYKASVPLSPGASFVFNWSELSSKDAVSFGNLRIAWGQTNNLPGPGKIRSVLERFRSDWFDERGYTLENLYAVTMLRPELVRDLEIGSDIHLLDDRIGLSINYYKRTSLDQIVLREVSSGLEKQFEPTNQGKIKSRGIEFSLFNPKPMSFGKLKWNWWLNLSHHSGKYEELSVLGEEGAQIIQTAGDWSNAQIRAQEGQAFGAIYGFPYARYGNLELDDPTYLDQPWLIDENGHPVRQLDRVVLGNIFPNWIMGIQQQLQFKNISLNFLLERRQGGDVINGTMGHMVSSGIAKLTENRWYADEDPYANARQLFEGFLEDGSPNTQEATLDNQYYADILAFLDENLVEDASWWRLRFVKLAYIIPFEGQKSTFLKDISLFITGRNIWLSTQYSGIDPERTAYGGNFLPGYDEASIPATKSWEFGLKARF